MALDLEAIKARHAATSAGPWSIRREFNVYSESADRAVATNAHSSNGSHDQNIANMAFIAEAHADIPALVAEVGRLRAEISEARKEALELAELFGMTPEDFEPEKELTEDARVFGDGAWVYCKQHCKPHQTGWCGVGVRDKIALGVDNAKDALQKCRDWGFDLYQDRPL